MSAPFRLATVQRLRQNRLDDAAARAADIPDDWITAAQRSPIWDLIMKYEVALPLHPEYRTMPMVWYIPPLSPVVDVVRDTGEDAEDKGNLFAAIDALRIPVGQRGHLRLQGGGVGEPGVQRGVRFGGGPRPLGVLPRGADQLGVVLGEKEVIQDIGERTAQMRSLQEAEAFFRSLCDATPAALRLLDVGCAYGWFLEAARSRGMAAVGVEVVGRRTPTLCTVNAYASTSVRSLRCKARTEAAARQPYSEC